MPVVNREELSILKQIRQVKKDISDLDSIKMQGESLTTEQTKSYTKLERTLKSLEEQTVTTAGKTQILIENFAELSQETDTVSKNFKKLSNFIKSYFKCKIFSKIF